jgi:transcriptional regulator with XRE-family HTH domain
MKKATTNLDKEIGYRLRMARQAANLSQERLGEQLGITFQQIQKYERGTNRVSASRLQQIAGILNVPLSFFFNERPGSEGSDLQAAYSMDPQVQLLVTAFHKMSKPVRKKIVDLCLAVAGEAPEPAA